MPRRTSPTARTRARTASGTASAAGPGGRTGTGAVTLPPGARCPCGLPAAYPDCCGALHAGRAQATTAERLMRSRYSAFAVRDAGYLLRTWAARERPPEVAFEPGVRWTGLEVFGTTGGTAFHAEGTVEFAARYRKEGRDGEQRENSRFVREGGLWVYLDARG